jgi:hypothetical protein
MGWHNLLVRFLTCILLIPLLRCSRSLSAGACRTIDALEWQPASSGDLCFGNRDTCQSDANYGRRASLYHSTPCRTGSAYGRISEARSASASLLVPLVGESRYRRVPVLSGLLVPHILISWSWIGTATPTGAGITLQVTAITLLLCGRRRPNRLADSKLLIL